MILMIEWFISCNTYKCCSKLNLDVAPNHTRRSPWLLQTHIGVAITCPYSLQLCNDYYCVLPTDKEVLQ